MARRKLYTMECVEYFYEWFECRNSIVQHNAWYDDSRRIDDMRPSMRKGNFYRLFLSDGTEVVVTERQRITVECY